MCRRVLNQRAEVIDAHERQASKQGSQQRLVRRLELDDEARALVVDTRTLDPGLAAQPTECGFSHGTAAAERGNKQPQAPGHEMANCKFHR